MAKNKAVCFARLPICIHFYAVIAPYSNILVLTIRQMSNIWLIINSTSASSSPALCNFWLIRCFASYTSSYNLSHSEPSENSFWIFAYSSETPSSAIAPITISYTVFASYYVFLCVHISYTTHALISTKTGRKIPFFFDI